MHRTNCTLVIYSNTNSVPHTEIRAEYDNYSSRVRATVEVFPKEAKTLRELPNVRCVSDEGSHLTFYSFEGKITELIFDGKTEDCSRFEICIWERGNLYRPS